MAVTALRQARTADYGNFEAAWELSRADTYLVRIPSMTRQRTFFAKGRDRQNRHSAHGSRPVVTFGWEANYGGSAQRVRWPVWRRWRTSPGDGDRNQDG